MDQRVATLLKQYIEQQKELAYPMEYICSSPLPAEKVEGKESTFPIPTFQNETPLKEAVETTQKRKNVVEERDSVTPNSTRLSEKREQLKQLYQTVHNCYKCSIASTRTKAVFGAGNANADVMVIGEAPGFHEDQQGLPFVGSAGQLLTKMLSAIGLDRKKDVFIANTLKCRPPQNRTPHAEERENCAPYLQQQITIIEPKALLLVGRTAAAGLLGLTETMAQMRTQAYSYMGKPVIITYHPSALLRNPDLKRASWEDLQRFQAILRDLHATATE